MPIEKGMPAGWVVWCMMFFLTGAEVNLAEARPPETKAESSLIYWRFLCRGGAQVERRNAGRRELQCLSQGWTVSGPEAQGEVDEVRGHE